MRPEIIARLVKTMAASGLDAVVVVSPENFAYVSGFVIPSQSLMRWRHAAYVVTASGRCGILVVDMEETTTRAKANGVEVRAWGEFTDKPMAVLANLLSDYGLAAARIGRFVMRFRRSLSGRPKWISPPRLRAASSSRVRRILSY